MTFWSQLSICIRLLHFTLLSLVLLLSIGTSAKEPLTISLPFAIEYGCDFIPFLKKAAQGYTWHFQDPSAPNSNSIIAQVKIVGAEKHKDWPKNQQTALIGESDYNKYLYSRLRIKIEKVFHGEFGLIGKEINLLGLGIDDSGKPIASPLPHYLKIGTDLMMVIGIRGSDKDIFGELCACQQESRKLTEIIGGKVSVIFDGKKQEMTVDQFAQYIKEKKY